MCDRAHAVLLSYQIECESSWCTYRVHASLFDLASDGHLPLSQVEHRERQINVEHVNKSTSSVSHAYSMIPIDDCFIVGGHLFGWLHGDYKPSMYAVKKRLPLYLQTKLKSIICWKYLNKNELARKTERRRENETYSEIYSVERSITQINLFMIFV